MVLGLTLEGGGAKGSYQIGTWKAFKELGIEFDGISGTSVGALNGALMVQKDFDLAHEIWHEISPTTIMDIDDRLYEMIADYDLSTNNIQVMYDEIKRIVKGLGIDTKPLRQLVNKYVKEESIRNSTTDFGFVTVCLTERRPMEIYKEDVPLGKMGDYLMASSYLPIFKSSKLDGKVFIDGGFYNNLPIEMLYKKGIKKVIAVRLLSHGRVKKVEYDDLEITYITPNQPLGGVMDFTKDRARNNIALGYYDTLKVFKNLKGKNYYLQAAIEDHQAIKFFMELNKETIEGLGELFNLSHALPANRLLLEGIIPKLINLMELDKGATYSDVLIGLIENMAGCKNIDPFEVYDIRDLLKNVMHLNYSKKIENKDTLMGRYIVNEIVLRLDKEKLLKEAIKVILRNNNSLTIPSS